MFSRRISLLILLFPAQCLDEISYFDLIHISASLVYGPIIARLPPRQQDTKRAIPAWDTVCRLRKVKYPGAVYAPG